MVFIFNSKREFWNSFTREFQKEPFAIRTATEAQMEIRMAGKRDDTSDMLQFEEQFMNEALRMVKGVKFTKARLKALRDMNGCLR